MKNTLTKNTVNILLAGKLRQYKKYAGKHVLVVQDKIIPLKTGESFWRDFKKLENKYNEKPVITFVPSPEVSYILYLWK